MKKNILIISDGNGVDNGTFKKWPILLQLLHTKTLNIINRSVVGSSNEIMLYKLADAIKEQPIDYAIIQWTNPQRLDVVADTFWNAEAAKDNIYDFNLVNTLGETWWVSSGSVNPNIREYHNKYIKAWHAVQRTQSYMLAAAELLKQSNIKFSFSLCYDFEFVGPMSTVLNQYHWAWHTPNSGISEFRNSSQYVSYDTGQAQPHTLVQLDWINQVLKPSFEFIDYDDKTYYNIEQSLIKICLK
jgi:hypothetical protein